MHNFKHIFLSIVSFVLLFIILSAFAIAPVLYTEYPYYQDRWLREDLAGQIDTAIIGASHGVSAFDPRIIDKELDCFSYNFSEAMMNGYSKYYFIDKEMKRNPFKTIVIEVAYDTLAREEDKEYAIGDCTSVNRLDNMGERLSFMCKYVNINDWLNIYSRDAVEGLSFWKKYLLGGKVNNVNYEAKGFHETTSKDMSLPKDEILSSYNSGKVSEKYVEADVKELEELINLCKQNNLRIILAVTTITDSTIWKTSNMDSFYKWNQEFSNKEGIEFYDMNLLRNRYDYFSDKTSFCSKDHLSFDGAQIMTKQFCNIINKVDSQIDINNLFYESYEQLKMESPYAQNN